MSRKEHTFKRFLRCEFTEKELLELARTLGEKNRESDELEDQKKRVTSDFKAKIDGVSSEISELSRKVTTGYEFRDVPCRAEYNMPKPGKKEVYRIDTGALVGIEDMTAAELQTELNLEDDPEERIDEALADKEEEAIDV